MHFTVTAGHGGSDPGNTWGGHSEARLMTELRFIVAMKLREAGHTVAEDGGRGENWTLAEATRLIKGADLAVELHTNASSNTRAEGVEVVADIDRAKEARIIANAIGGTLQIPVRRDGGWLAASQVKRDRGFLPAFCRHGGLIVEVFFQSNPTELSRYLERRWLVATAIARSMEAACSPS